MEKRIEVRTVKNEGPEQIGVVSMSPTFSPFLSLQTFRFFSNIRNTHIRWRTGFPKWREKKRNERAICWDSFCHHDQKSRPKQFASFSGPSNCGRLSINLNCFERYTPFFFFAFQNRCEREENTKTGSLMSPPFVLFFNWNSPFRNVWYWITLVAKMRELECGRQVLKKEKKQKKKEGWVENFCQRSKTIRQITGACYISHWISTMRVRGQTKLESQEKSKTLLHIGRWKWVVRSIVSFADPSSILLAC